MKDENSPASAEPAVPQAEQPPIGDETLPTNADLANAVTESAGLVAESLPSLTENAISAYTFLLTQRDSLKYAKETADTIMEINRVLVRKGAVGGTSPLQPVPLANVPVSALNILTQGIVTLASRVQADPKPEPKEATHDDDIPGEWDDEPLPPDEG